jgi:hypothetical protein
MHDEAAQIRAKPNEIVSVELVNSVIDRRIVVSVVKMLAGRNPVVDTVETACHRDDDRGDRQCVQECGKDGRHSAKEQGQRDLRTEPNDEFREGEQ